MMLRFQKLEISLSFFYLSPFVCNFAVKISFLCGYVSKYVHNYDKSMVSISSTLSLLELQWKFYHIFKGTVI